MPYKNPEKQKEYYEKNKEQIKEYKKQYSKDNKEQIKEYKKQYYENNKDKYSIYMKEYKKTEKGIKVNRISSWKYLGLISEDYNKIYERYLITKECDNCGIELNQDEATRKCMDHCHSTGKFRNILCKTCNVSRG